MLFGSREPSGSVPPDKLAADKTLGMHRPVQQHAARVLGHGDKDHLEHRTPDSSTVAVRPIVPAAVSWMYRCFVVREPRRRRSADSACLTIYCYALCKRNTVLCSTKDNAKACAALRLLHARASSRFTSVNRTTMDISWSPPVGRWLAGWLAGAVGWLPGALAGWLAGLAGWLGGLVPAVSIGIASPATSSRSTVRPTNLS